MKKTQQMMFQWQLKTFNLPQERMVQFYTAVVESILTLSIPAWVTAYAAKEKSRFFNES